MVSYFSDSTALKHTSSVEISADTVDSCCLLVLICELINVLLVFYYLLRNTNWTLYENAIISEKNAKLVGYDLNCSLNIFRNKVLFTHSVYNFINKYLSHDINQLTVKSIKQSITKKNTFSNTQIMHTKRNDNVNLLPKDEVVRERSTFGDALSLSTE